MTTFNTLLNKEQFKQFRTAYKTLARERKLTPADIIVYNLIRGLPANRGFTAITNPTKLANGAQEWGSFIAAKGNLQYRFKYRAADACKQYNVPEDLVPQLTSAM